AAHYHQQHKQREKQLKDAIEQCFETELEIITVSERKHEIEAEAIKTELNGLLTKLKAEKKKYKTAKSANEDIQNQLNTLDKLIAELEKPYKELDEKKTKIESIEVLIKQYKTIEGIKSAFELQTKTLHQREKLQTLSNFLSSNNLKKEFEASEYA